MELYRDLFKKYDNIHNIDYGIFETIYKMFTYNQLKEINDFKKLIEIRHKIEHIEMFYRKENNLKDPLEELFDQFQEIYNDESIKLKKFILYYNLLINKNDENNKRIKDSIEDDDLIPVINKIKEFIETLNSQEENESENESENQSENQSGDWSDLSESNGEEEGSFSDYSDDIHTDDEEIQPPSNPEVQPEPTTEEREEEENIQVEGFDTLNDFYHENQKMAIKNQREQGFKSGLHSQIMGAGKSFIILQTISDLNNSTIYKINNNKNVVFLITYRQEVLRNWFFKKEFYKVDNTKYKYVKNTEAYKKWKDLGIIDLDEYDIIDAINDKDKKVFLNLPDNKKTLVIINTTFFNLIPSEGFRDKLKAIIIDECHCITQKVFTEKLRKIKSNNLPIIGFSATPLRESKNSIIHLKEFFGNGNIINIISSYTLMDGIHDNIILPFKYHLVNSISNRKHQIFDKIFDEIYPTLVFKKISAWTRTGDSLENWHNYLKPKYELNPKYEHIKMYVNSVFNDRKSFNNTPKDFEKFKAEAKNAMMLCINMFKEGTDVPDLDCGIYLDPVKNRSFTVSLQTAGRVLRLDKKYPENKKKFGTIIDFFVSEKGDRKAEELTVNRIVDYYESLINLTDNITEKEKIAQLQDFIDKTEFDPEERKIKLKIDDNPEHNCEFIIDTSMLDWTKFSDLYKKKVNRILKLTKDEVLLKEFNELKEIIKEENKVRQIKINGNLSISEGIRYVLSKFGNLTPKEIYLKIKELKICPKLGVTGITPEGTVTGICCIMLKKNKIQRVSEDPIKYSYNKVFKFELIDTIDKYRTFAEEKDLELDPDIIYDKLWTNWYDFLGIDTSIFPQTKEEWKQICIENNLNDLTYYDKCYELNLPLMPEEMYKGNYTNIIAELSKNKYEDYGDNI
jgi:superfamily II DNA or RNA helicase